MGPQDNITAIDDYLDRKVAYPYKAAPLAQDWARVSKIGEEFGEAIDALIGVTGQNPRKGHYGSHQELTKELLDVACTALLAVEHFEKDGLTWRKLQAHLYFLKERING